MQIVIDIGEHNKNVIDRFVNGEGFEVLPTPIVDDVIRAVRNGKSLPKGCGRLIDAREYENSVRKHYFDNATVIRCTEIALDNASPIIEADKEG